MLFRSTQDVESKYIVAENSHDKTLYQYVQGKKEIAALIQNLEKEETDLVMKGLGTEQLLAKRQELQQKASEIEQKALEAVPELRGKI